MNNALAKKIPFAILSFVFLIIMHIGIKNFGGPIALPVAYLIWIGIVLFIAVSICFAVISSRFVEPRILKYVLLFICLSLITISFNQILDYHSFLYKTLGLIGGLIFFVSLHQLELTAPERDRLLLVIFISGLIEACIGIVQYLAPGHPFLFINPTMGRIYGSFQQPNVFASFIATAIVISFFLVSRPLFKRLTAMYKFGFFCLTAVTGFALYSSGSRAGLIGMMLGVLVLLSARLRIYKKITAALVCWSIALVVGMSSGYLLEKMYLHENVLPSKLSGTIKIDHVRIIYYGSAYKMIEDKPLIGCGFGNFGSKYLYYQRAFLQKHPQYIKDNENYYVSHPHNEILYRLAESGIFGGAGLVILFSAFGYIIFRLGREKGGLYLSLVLPIAFHTQVEYPLYQSAAHWMLFLILVYLPSSHFTRDVSLKLNRAGRLAVAAVATAAAVLMTFFLIRTFRAQTDLVKYNRLLTSKGQIRIQLLTPALDNSYLEQIATRLFMDARLRVALSHNKGDWTKEFVDWSKRERIATPYSALYVRESLALYALGKKKDAFDLVDEGLSLYPNKSDLLQTKLNLMAKEIEFRIKESGRLIHAGKR